MICWVCYIYMTWQASHSVSRRVLDGSWYLHDSLSSWFWDDLLSLLYYMTWQAAHSVSRRVLDGSWYLDDSLSSWYFDDLLSSWYLDDLLSSWYLDDLLSSWCLDDLLSSWYLGDILSWWCMDDSLASHSLGFSTISRRFVQFRRRFEIVVFCWVRDICLNYWQSAYSVSRRAFEGSWHLDDSFEYVMFGWFVEFVMFRWFVGKPLTRSLE